MLTRKQIKEGNLVALNFYLRAHDREPSEEREIAEDRAWELTLDLIVEKAQGAAEDAKERLGRWRESNIRKFDKGGIND